MDQENRSPSLSPAMAFWSPVKMNRWLGGKGMPTIHSPPISPWQVVYSSPASPVRLNVAVGVPKLAEDGHPDPLFQKETTILVPGPPREGSGAKLRYSISKPVTRYSSAMPPPDKLGMRPSSMSRSVRGPIRNPKP